MMERFIALRYLLGRRLGFTTIITLISIVGVMAGTFLLIVTLSVMNGFEKEVRDRILGTFAHGRVLMRYGEFISEPDSIRNDILKHPNVIAAAPFIMGKGAVENLAVQEGVMIMALDDSLEKTVTDIHKKVIAGEFNLDSAESLRGRTYPAIIIGNGLAEKLSLGVNSELVMMTLAMEEGEIDPTPVVMRFTISGVFETGMYEYDQSLIFISIASGQKMFLMNGVEGMSYKCSDMNLSTKIGEELVEQLGPLNYKFGDWQTQNKSLFQWMKLEKLIGFLVLMVIVLIAALNIITSLIMKIMEKQREIGILMSMGASRKSIMKIFMMSGIAISLIGSTVGTTLGVILSALQMHFHVFKIPNDVYFVNFLPSQLFLSDVLFVFLTANIVSLLATIYPAWRASQVLPAQAVRFD